MAGRSRKTPEAIIPTTALVASAVRYPGKVPRLFHPSQPWQSEAYRHYGICGEARFGANYMGTSLSRARLYTAERVGKEIIEADADSQSAKILAELFHGPEAQAQMLKSVGIHLTVAGEFYIVGRKPSGILERDRGSDPKAETIWEIVSVLEITGMGDRWVINYGDGHPPVELDDDDVVIRVWTPDPARRMEADSPFKSLLPTLSEIEYLTLHIFAQCRSRLAGAGILWVPSEMDFPAPPLGEDGKPMAVNNEAEGLMFALAEAMVEDIHDQGDPNSVVPIALSAPGEHIDKAKLMHFWSDLDEKALEMRSAAVHRFALGMDLPPEQILGMSSNQGTGGGKSTGVSHWGQWQIDESTIKLHTEPMLDALCSALTVSFLRPGGAVDSIILFDTTALRLRPDRSLEAITLYNLGLIKAEIVVRENGFDPDSDMPDEEERKTWLMLKVATGSATPDMVHAILTKQFGLDVGPVPSSVSQGDPEQGLRETRPEPSMEDHEVRREPDRSDSEAAALVNVCHAMMYRGLERAGNRLRRTAVNKPNCPAYETHTLIKANGSTAAVLDDAFGNANLVLDGIADYTAVVPSLQSYAEHLLSHQQPHTKVALEDWLRIDGVIS